MKSSIIKKILKIVSILCFVVGLLFAVWALISLKTYFTTTCDNRIPPAGSFLGGSSDEFSFAVMSDSGDRHKPVEAIIKEMKKQDIKFILHLGDIARRLRTSHFESLLKDINEWAGDTPFYVIPGNHDALKDKVANYNFYKRAFGQRNYWFGYGDTLFIGLDTALGTFGKKQQTWLENVMKHMRSQFKNCIVFMHVPPNDPRPKQSYSMRSDTDELKALFTKYKVNALLCGHIHEYHKAKFADIPMYIVPPSGQRMRGQTKMYGYLLCKKEKDGKLAVTKINVTDNKGRNYLKFFLSTELNGITSTIIATALFIAAFLLLFFSQQKAQVDVGEINE